MGQRVPLVEEVLLLIRHAVEKHEGGAQLLHDEYCRLSNDRQEWLVKGIVDLGNLPDHGWFPWKEVQGADHKLIGLEMRYGKESIDVSLICPERSKQVLFDGRGG